MPLICPKCNYINPWGAEICGECGISLLPEKKTKKPQIHIKSKQKRSPIIFTIIGSLILLNSIFLIGVAIVPFFLSYKIDYIYWFVALFLTFGALGFVVSYGLLRIKQWLFSVYSMWVAIKLFLYVLLWAEMFKIIPARWLYPSRMRAFLCLLIIEIILIPFIFKAHNKS